MKYLRKRKMYELAVKVLSNHDLPMCIDCTYKAYSGYEWLSFDIPTGSVVFTVAKGGQWFRVVEKDLDGAVIYDRVLNKNFISACNAERGEQVV